MQYNELKFNNTISTDLNKDVYTYELCVPST